MINLYFNLYIIEIIFAKKILIVEFQPKIFLSSSGLFIKL